MKCTNCGYEIPAGMLYCKRCGEEVCIVPDYNPLDDMLTTQIRVSMDDDSEYLYNNRTVSGRSNTGRGAINRNNTTRSNSARNNTSRNSTTRNNTTRNNTSRPRTPEEREARRRQAERRREIKRKKRRILLIIMSVILALFIGLVILLYQTSYTGIVKKGNKALLSAEYAIAQERFEKAISKKPSQSEAYVGLSHVYIAKGNLTSAEKVFLDAVSEYPDNASIYEALIEFYLETNQALEIPTLLAKAEESVRDSLSMYIIAKPEYSLETGKVYDDVQQLTLISSEEKIYYTLDGTEPTFSSTLYKEPIQLDEGETIVKAIAVNKKGIPGLPESKTYVIELPIEDAPAVSPSTGQYEENMKIEIKVPEGYTAYYTMDGTTPTTASTKYTGPINMPENDTLFKAILVNAGGRSSGVTTRNYILDIPEEEE